MAPGTAVKRRTGMMSTATAITAVRPATTIHPMNDKAQDCGPGIKARRRRDPHEVIGLPRRLHEPGDVGDDSVRPGRDHFDDDGWSRLSVPQDRLPARRSGSLSPVWRSIDAKRPSRPSVGSDAVAGCAMMPSIRQILAGTRR